MKNNNMNRNIESSNKLAKRFRIIGGILVTIGVIMLIFAFSTLFKDATSTDTSFEESSRAGITGFIEFFIAIISNFIGIALLTTGSQKQIAQYESGQMAPIVKDTTNYMLDGTKDAISDIISEVVRKSKGDYDPDDGYENKSFCPNCGTEVEENDTFCPNCGKRLD